MPFLGISNCIAARLAPPWRTSVACAPVSEVECLRGHRAAHRVSCNHSSGHTGQSYGRPVILFALRGVMHRSADPSVV